MSPSPGRPTGGPGQAPPSSQATPLTAIPSIRSILVLCVGNHCRAPIAEGLFRAALEPAIQVASAGLKALVDAPAHPEAVRLMAGDGHDISAHRGRQLTADMAREADVILVMDADQKEWCTQQCPSARGRIFLLGHWLSRPSQAIEDPYGQEPAVFRQVYDDIQESVSAWIPHLLSKQRSA